MAAADDRPILFVGDIQGCSRELELLLERARFRTGSHRLIPIGDTINRGPDAAGVLALLDQTQAEPILGNHELALLQIWQRRQAPAGEPPGSAFRQLTEQGQFDSAMSRIAAWPLVRRGNGWIAVHAGLHPRIEPEATESRFLTEVRYCDELGHRPPTKLESGLSAPPGFRPWYEHYHGAETVIFGHWAARGLVRQERIRGLDTGCVYGRTLTGLWWPGDEQVQVPALRVYAKPKSAETARAATS